jgi:hypothetical protein
MDTWLEWVKISQEATKCYNGAAGARFASFSLPGGFYLAPHGELAGESAVETVVERIR